jgi:hypothetical protein
LTTKKLRGLSNFGHPLRASSRFNLMTCHAEARAMLHLVENQRFCPPETIVAMTAAFNRLCESIPKSVNGDDLRRELARIVLRHVDRGVQDPERLYEIMFWNLPASTAQRRCARHRSRAAQEIKECRSCR